MFLMAFALVAADDLSASVASQSGNPGSTVTYTITYTNAGATDMTVSSTSSTLSDGTHSITAPSISSVTVPAASSATVSFTIAVPSTAAGVYTGTITGTDTTNSANTESLSYSLTVNSIDAFTTSTNSVSMDLQGGNADTTTFTITNTGSTTLSTWSLGYTSSDGDTGKVRDNDNDETSVSLTGASSLSPGSSMTITVHADPDSTMDLGTYSGTLSISGTGSSTITSTIDLELTINADICQDGKQGNDFSIDIREPNDGDNFVPGDTVPLEVKVKNSASNDLDVVVEVTLYNLDTGNVESTQDTSGSINEGDTETFNIDFDLPSDLSDKDNYRFYVQVHEDGNEDDSCDYESVDVDINREDQGASISEITITPNTGLVCGDDYTVYVTSQSTGSNSIKDLYVQLQDADLQIQKDSDTFSLGDYNDNDNEAQSTFDLSIPTDLDTGSYSLEAILHDNSGKTLDSKLVTVNVDSCTASDAAADLLLDISKDYTVKNGELTLGMLVTNNGANDATISITPSDVDWATLTGSEYLTSLAAGSAEHAYLYFTLDTKYTGQHDLEITVTDENGNTITKTVTVDFGVGTSNTEQNGFFSSITKWLANHGQGMFWIIVDVILIILALVFARMLFSKK